MRLLIALAFIVVITCLLCKEAFDAKPLIAQRQQFLADGSLPNQLVQPQNQILVALSEN